VNAYEIAQGATTVAFVGLALAAVRVHLRHRSDASRWLLVTFALIGSAVVIGRLVPDEPAGGVARLLALVPAALLIAFPYALLRFAGTFRSLPTTLRRGADVTLVLLLVALPFAIDPATDPDARTVGQTAYVWTVLGYWTALTLVVVARLWRGGRGQAGVARRRLRTLATASGLLNVALLVTVPAAGDQLIGVLVQGIALGSALLFLLGFAPSGLVRREWRAADEALLRAAERDLMTATDVETVGAAVLPPLARLFSGEAVLLDADGHLVGAAGGAGVADAARAVPRPAPGVVDRGEDALVLGLQHGSLLVRTDAFTPFFGTEEIGLLRGAGSSLDLALSRVHLQASERAARQLAEETNSELEALLYGISHDLRAPLVALTGYVELLLDGDDGEEERRFILDRVTANTSYMDALIRDLLELSRVGRITEQPEPVDLGALVAELGDELQVQHPESRVTVAGLPTVTMERVRARQLLGNLLANALRHGGRDDITVAVTADAVDDGVVISVADDGIGIDPEHRQRVFGIFERLQGRDERTGGTGIGLAMCRKIVEQLGGSMWIADTPAGTDIRFLVPSGKIRPAPSRSLEPSA
jgi:signal transduction histidine kinase